MSADQDDLLVLSRFKNLRLWEQLHQLHMTARDLAEKAQVPLGAVYQLMGLRESARKQNGTFRKAAEDLAKFFGLPVEELFPDSLYALRLPRTVARSYSSVTLLPLLAASHLTQLPQTVVDDELDANKRALLVAEQLETLNPREELVLRMRFGLPPYEREHTYAEIASAIGKSIERARVLTERALRRLRYAQRAARLQPLVLTHTLPVKLGPGHYVGSGPDWCDSADQWRKFTAAREAEAQFLETIDVHPKLAQPKSDDTVEWGLWAKRIKKLGYKPEVILSKKQKKRSKKK